MSFLFTFQDLLLETAPWLLLGLFSAGVVKAWIPEALVFRWLGGNGWKPILRGALVGTPLPLCSCGVIPMAMGLRRKGASKAATVSFLVATPETGVDSIAISWAMLGPVLTVARPVAAIISAVVSGLLVLSIDSRSEKTAPTASCANPSPPDAPDARPACCTSQCASTTREVINSNAMATLGQRLQSGLHFATHDLWDDLAIWLIGGLVVTAVVMTWMPPNELNALSNHGWLAMLVMILVSVPIYVCATASTPIAAAMLYSGLSPGMALAFMIAGPATNLATLVIVHKELGRGVLVAYLTGIVVSAMALGLLLDEITVLFGTNMPSQHLSPTQEWLPSWLAWGSTMILAWLTLGSLSRKIKVKNLSAIARPNA